MADESMGIAAVGKAPRRATVAKLTHMIHTAEYVSKRRPKFIRMNEETLNDYFTAIKGWSGRDYDGIMVIIDDSLAHCEIGMVFDVGSE